MDFRKSRTSPREIYQGRHRFEHWYKDNQVYFITSRCRNKYPAFQSESAKQIFWKQFDRYAAEFQFEPWVASLMSNHYHVIGYLHRGRNLPKFMQRLHGSVAKLVNDVLEVRLVPFFIDSRKQNYFDGCLRDVRQLRRAFRYTYLQSVRHGICRDSSRYSHTRIWVELERSVEIAVERRALMEGVPYARYGKRHGKYHAG